MIVFLVSRRTSLGIFSSQVLPILQDGEADICFYDSGADAAELLTKQCSVAKVLRFRDILKLMVAGRAVTFVTREVVGYVRVFLLGQIFYHVDVKHDFRALYSEELMMGGSGKWKILLVRFLEFLAWKTAAGVRVVSRFMAEYCEQKFGVRGDVLVVPSFHNKHTDESALFHDDFYSLEPVLQSRKFVYVGGMSAWQNFDRTIELYLAVCEASDSLTVYTQDVVACGEVLHRYGLSDLVEVRTESQSAILKQLPLYDFGFILRSDSLVNKLSSPLKFLEYTSSGIIPIMTDNVGDYSELFRDVAVNVDGKSTAEVQRSIRSAMSNRQIYRQLLIERSAQYSYDAQRAVLQSWLHT